MMHRLSKDSGSRRSVSCSKWVLQMLLRPLIDGPATCERTLGQPWPFQSIWIWFCLTPMDLDSKRKDRGLCWYVDDWNKSFKNLDRCFSWGSPTATSGKSCPQMFVDHVSKFSVVSNTKVASWPRSSKRPQPPLLSDYKMLSVLRVLGCSRHGCCFCLVIFLWRIPIKALTLRIDSQASKAQNDRLWGSKLE